MSLKLPDLHETKKEPPKPLKDSKYNRFELSEKENLRLSYLSKAAQEFENAEAYKNYLAENAQNRGRVIEDTTSFRKSDYDGMEADVDNNNTAFKIM